NRRHIAGIHTRYPSTREISPSHECDVRRRSIDLRVAKATRARRENRREGLRFVSVATAASGPAPTAAPTVASPAATSTVPAPTPPLPPPRSSRGLASLTVNDLPPNSLPLSA